MNLNFAIVLLLQSLQFCTAKELVFVDPSYLQYGARSKAGLQLGASCNFEYEAKRQKLYRKLEELMDNGGQVNKYMEENLDLVEELMNSNKVCRSGDLLVCDQNKEKCVCGEWVFIGKDPSEGYVLESVNGKKSCRYAKDAPCGNNMIAQERYIKGKYSGEWCQKGTFCTSVTNLTTPCVHEFAENYAQTLIQQIVKQGGFYKREIRKAMLQGKLCKCLAPHLQEEL